MDERMTKRARKYLRFLIEQDYSMQEEFALDIHVELRTVNRWINNGISKVDTIQYLADRFGLTFLEIFRAIP